MNEEMKKHRCYFWVKWPGTELFLSQRHKQYRVKEWFWISSTEMRMLHFLISVWYWSMRFKKGYWFTQLENVRKTKSNEVKEWDWLEVEGGKLATILTYGSASRLPVGRIVINHIPSIQSFQLQAVANICKMYGKNMKINK